ncbi:MAG TPA: cold shock domain-containing protein [Flavobacterium sp.]|jgi:CspA family cold shock protein|uniref:cold-shock protein n=1 Tax=Flavobacterium sp. TaxID=239 RepID=UPI002BB6D86A|nr:cold shock domain-containing protein [Flavobacterium sp.]MCA0349104.1 cold shock domain-containing protein [Bacteroidota bacterium]HPW98529.1 cold shock domain-containing protein [Flavobacterium sp.]HQA73570.1 cold shock domain-containing protein [Flavobacterium sp.]
MNEGTIKFFNEAKGFGFITPADGSSDVFVHATSLNGQVRENDKVTYDLEEGRKGIVAVNVTVV